MADKERKELARAAGDGDIEAARGLLAVVERESAQDPLGSKVLKRIEGGRLWADVIEVVRSNATGRLWLVGGKVYRTLAEVLRPGCRAGASKCDFDFMSEGKTRFAMLPTNSFRGEWTAEDRPVKSKMDVGARKFSRDEDPVADLLTFDLMRRRGVPPTIDGYFASVPFDVQAVAIDLEMRRIFGPGVDAIRSGSVNVNNEAEAKAYARRVKEDVEDLLNERSWSLGFRNRPRPGKKEPTPAKYYSSRDSSYDDDDDRHGCGS